MLREFIQRLLQKFRPQEEEFVSPFRLYEPDPFYLEGEDPEDPEVILSKEYHVINTETGMTSVHARDRSYIKDASGKEVWSGPR